MNPIIQSGKHPDAESLTAFAEQLLSGVEREQILAHMAVCSRCREVVFLSQQAVEIEEPVPAVMQPESRKAVAPGWFSGWRWAWIPVAALAGFVGIAVIQHERHPLSLTQQQVAQLAPETTPVQNATTAKSAESPAPVKQQASKQISANRMMNELAAARKKENPVAARDDRALDEKRSEESKQKDLGGIGGSLGAISPQGVSGGSSHGMVAARAKSPSMGGPAALNQFQQQNMNQLEQNNALQAERAAGAQQTLKASDALRLDSAREADKSAYLANKPVTPPPPGSVTETVNVSAEPIVPVQSPAAAAPTPQISSVASQSLGLTRKSLSKLKGAKLILPGGAEALSVATAGRRTVAIDTTGAVFLSQDAGKRWQLVKAQWTGRPVLVRTKQIALHGAVLSPDEQAQFELVTDKLGTWSSPDGSTWTLELPAAK
jgi:hypothetical protein